MLGFASRGLKPSERNMSNYSTMMLELLALYWAVTQTYRDLLIRSRLVVYTDNNPVAICKLWLGLVQLRHAGSRRGVTA